MEGAKGILSGSLDGEVQTRTPYSDILLILSCKTHLCFFKSVVIEATCKNKQLNNFKTLHATAEILNAKIMYMPLLAAQEIAWLEWFAVDPSDLRHKHNR
jgi:hypothetical protein